MCAPTTAASMGGMDTLTGLDVATIRADFPILARRVNGRPLVYLDSAATAQKPRAVIDAIVRYYEENNANVHRGAHTLADEATDAYEAARAKVAAFLGAADPRGLVFTRNATEAINLVAQAWGGAVLAPGDEIVATEMEHHSNLVPWQMIAAATGARLRVAPVRPEAGELDLDRLFGLLGERTRLVALTHCSNVLGTINPVERIAAAARARGALVLVDAAQSAPHLPIDVAALGADFVALSAHKLCGPMGVGALWARPELLAAMPPVLGGGSMIREVWSTHATWADAPARFEAGTPSVADAIGFGAAVDYLGGVGMGRIRAHEVELTGYALARLGELPGLRLYGPTEGGARSGVVSFNLFDDRGALIHPHDVGTVLDAAGIAIRVGQHCAQPLMHRLGVPATARASFYLYNTLDEVDALVEGLVECRRIFAR
jgi:cysteine desulfurase/selenocysteine lyase